MQFGARRSPSWLWLIGCSTAAFATSPTLAQETGDAAAPKPTLPAAVEGAKTFLPADFTRFAPRNALDMLRNVPGFTIREATQERGLGTATGNVLTGSPSGPPSPTFLRLEACGTEPSMSADAPGRSASSSAATV